MNKEQKEIVKRINKAYSSLYILSNITWTPYRDDLFNMNRKEEKQHRTCMSNWAEHHKNSASINDCARLFTVKHIAESLLTPNKYKVKDLFRIKKSCLYAQSLVDNYKDSINKNENLSIEQKERASVIVDEYSNKINQIEENYNNQATPIAQRLEELPIEDQVEIIENDKGTLKKNLDEALFGKSGIKPQYERYLGDRDPSKLSTREKYEIIRKHVTSGEGKVNDTKVINKVGLGLQKKNPNIEGIDVKKNLSQQRERVVNLQRERVNKLNKIKDGLGISMEANEAERAFHLKMMDYPPKEYEEGNPESLMGETLDVNMGGNIVNGEVLKNCLDVENTKEFKERFRLVEDDELTYSQDDPTIVTGKNVFTYAIDTKTNERIDIGFKTYRSKDGAAGKTNNTMTYSTQMQNCFKTGEKP